MDQEENYDLVSLHPSIDEREEQEIKELNNEILNPEGIIANYDNYIYIIK